MIQEEAYREWVQSDPAYNQTPAWPKEHFPKAKYQYFKECGCFITSLAIMLRRFEIEKETDTTKFNPRILNDRLIDCGAFDSAADLDLSYICKLYPLVYEGEIPYTREAMVRLFDSSEPFFITVPGVCGARHAVVPDALLKDDAAVIDCAWQKERLSDFDRILELRIFRRRIASERPRIALTFDDGPAEDPLSHRLLDLLEKWNVRATFFHVGELVEKHPDNILRKYRMGCEIGNHTWSHLYGDEVTKEDILRTSAAISEITGEKPNCFRSPGGYTNGFIREICRKEGMPLYFWSVDPEDWKDRDAEIIYDRVMNRVKDGDIVLLHEIYESTILAVERIIPELLDRGWQLVTCDELIRAERGRPPEPGTQYLSARIIRNETGESNV